MGFKFDEKQGINTMDFNLECFPTYEAAFHVLAEAVTPWEELVKPVLATMPLFLCLYGDNGLPPEAEFETLEALKLQQEQTPEKVFKLVIEAPNHYWEEIILFVVP
jgi:hypothetical protein